MSDSCNAIHWLLVRAAAAAAAAAVPATSTRGELWLLPSLQQLAVNPTETVRYSIDWIFWCWMTGALCRLSLKPKSLLSLSSTSNFRDPLHIFGNSLHGAYASMHIAFASAPSVPVFCSPLNTSSNSVTRNYCCRGREVTLWFMDTLKFYANFNSAITGTNPYYWALSDPRRVIIVYYAISGYAELLIRRTLTTQALCWCVWHWQISGPGRLADGEL